MSESSDSLDRSSPIFVPDRLAISISVALLVSAAISWYASYYLMPLMMMGNSMMGSRGVAAIVSSLSFETVVFFVVVWVIGMVAMMFPAMMPIVLFYNKAAVKLEKNQLLAKVAGTPLFLSGYLATYALLGLSAYFVTYWALQISTLLPQISSLSVVAASAVLVATGLYQFTSLKTTCLSQCVSPLGFFTSHFRSGLVGSFRMGFSHGVFCVGCCWAYMLVMLAVGAMSIPVMAGLAMLIALEKVLLKGSAWFSRIVGAGFAGLGIFVWFFPQVMMLF